jgi:hypothetical protein
MFIRLNKEHKKYMPQDENSMGNDKELCYFCVNDRNAVALKYFDLRTSAVWWFQKVNSCLRMAK